MIPMQMEPQAIMSLGSKEQGCMWDADRKVEAGEQGFQAQPGKQPGWGFCERGGHGG